MKVKSMTIRVQPVSGSPSTPASSPPVDPVRRKATLRSATVVGGVGTAARLAGAPPAAGTWSARPRPGGRRGGQQGLGLGTQQPTAFVREGASAPLV